MGMSTQLLDRSSRRILQSARPDVCRHLGVGQLRPQMVSELYLRIRETLAQTTSPGGAVRRQTVDDLAVTIYMVAVAEARPGPALLTDLKRTLADMLKPDSDGAAGGLARPRTVSPR